ncbi:hypothetical protein [Frankia sp. R82]|uniref:hypothetical protein n=1 Tax=Frankia sp. R82 TaxID=2950553 RepID=UPI002042CE15|nr:hypothetical protein [Frankia sp. R82]MCM3883332.1 hypothetical protein [Frankia sp. R82]
MKVEPPGRDYNQFRAATEALRSTAKWLVTALAGVAVVLVAGVQLTSLGRLGAADWPRILLAALALLTSLISIGILVRDTTRVLTDSYVTVTEIQDAVIDGEFAVDDRSVRLRRLGEQIANLREELYAHVAPDLGTLLRRLREANARTEAIIAGETAPSPDEVEHAFARVRLLQDIAQDVADCANYFQTRDLVLGMRLRRSVAVALAAMGIVVFAWAGNPDQHARPTIVRIDRSAPASRLPEARG